MQVGEHGEEELPAGTRIITHPLKVKPKKDYNAHCKRIWGTEHNKDQGWIKCGVGSLRKFSFFRLAVQKGRFCKKCRISTFCIYDSLLHSLHLSLAHFVTVTLTRTGSLRLFPAHSGSFFLSLSQALICSQGPCSARYVVAA